jgi:hypothetical protein
MTIITPGYLWLRWWLETEASLWLILALLIVGEGLLWWWLSRAGSDES